MQPVIFLRRTARRLVARPSISRGLMACSFAVAAGSGAFLIVIAAVVAGPMRVWRACVDAGGDNDALRECVLSSPASMRAPLLLATPLVLVLILLAVGALMSVLPLLVARAERRKRDMLLEGRLARLEDAYARSLIRQGTYDEVRAHIEQGLRAGLRGDIARAEARLLRWVLIGSTPVLAIGGWLSYWLSLQTWGISSEPLLPGYWLAVLIAGATALALLVVAARQAQRESASAAKETERELEEQWARVLRESREASAAAVPTAPNG